MTNLDSHLVLIYLIITPNAARLVLRKKRDYITPMMKQLHCLPVRSRIKFKICLLTFKACNGLLHPSIFPHCWQIWASQTRFALLVKACYSRKFHIWRWLGAFSVCAPQIWNSLPKELKTVDKSWIVQKCLKTYLFQEAYCEVAAINAF